jgi:hypothetical protein
MAGSSRSLFPKLDCQTFAERSRKDARRIERLQRVQDGFHILGASAEAGGNLLDVAQHVTGLVELIDEMLSNQEAGRIDDQEGDLLVQVVAQRHLAGDEIIQVVVFAGLAARHRFPLAEQLRRIGAPHRAVIREDVFEARIEPFAEPLGADGGGALIPVAVDFGSRRTLAAFGRGKVVGGFEAWFRVVFALA